MGKTNKKIIWIAGLFAISMLNISSICSHNGPQQDLSIIDTAARLKTTAIQPAEADATEAIQAKEITWKMLANVEFQDVYVEELDAYYWKPSFGKSIKDIEGDEVYITGYVIPVDVDENFYVLSRYPFANCFFCGGAGPESVVDLRFAKENRTYKTDERLTFKGKFSLNADDVYQMNYILLDAEEYE